MATKKKKFFLRLDSKSSNLKLIRGFISQVADEAGFDEEDINKIELAVDEACSNVVKHAYPVDRSRTIGVEAVYDEKIFKVIVFDHGKGFDPGKFPQTDMKTYLQKYEVGGLGIHLMKSLMDEVEYNINPGKTNKVILKKFRK
ncbi:ATP-binding protein [candidate division KSB1 bacterium]